MWKTQATWLGFGSILSTFTKYLTAIWYIRRTLPLTSFDFELSAIAVDFPFFSQCLPTSNRCQWWPLPNCCICWKRSARLGFCFLHNTITISFSFCWKSSITSYNINLTVSGRLQKSTMLWYYSNIFWLRRYAISYIRHSINDCIIILIRSWTGKYSHNPGSNLVDVNL